MKCRRTSGVGANGSACGLVGDVMNAAFTFVVGGGTAGV